MVRSIELVLKEKALNLCWTTDAGILITHSCIVLQKLLFCLSFH